MTIQKAGVEDTDISHSLICENKQTVQSNNFLSSNSDQEKEKYRVSRR